jgi:hypothetical protein
VVCGLAAAFTAANELPATAFLGLLAAGLLWKAPRETLAGFLPAVLLVAAGFFGTNYLAHDSLRPPYAHRSATDPDDNWYEFTYTVKGRERQSYWTDPKGIDRGEPSRATYVFHTLIGHHGILSLTPVWLLSIWGTAICVSKRVCGLREFAALTAVLTIICLVFYLGFRPQQDRNYGGMTSGLRWMFWFAPFWLVVMVPAADRLSTSRAGQAFACVLLAFSVLSASYPTWNPWTQPWIYRWLEAGGWQGF